MAKLGDIDDNPEGYLDESAAWLDTGKLTEFNEPGFFTVAQVAALIVAARNRNPGAYNTNVDVSNAVADYVMLACLDIANGELDARNPGTMLPWTQYLKMIESGMYGDGNQAPAPTMGWLVPVEEAERWYETKGFNIDLSGVLADMQRQPAATPDADNLPSPPDFAELAHAIRERRRYLESVYSKDGRQPKQAGLVALSRAIFLLATQHLDHPEHYKNDPGELVKTTWEIQWLSDYMQALAELIPPIQDAIRTGKLVARGNKTRAPLSLEQCEHWLDVEPAAVMGHDMLNRAVAGNWPDAEILPSGICVIPAELQAWAESEGIAAPGEVLGLLSDKKDAPLIDAVEPATGEAPKERRARLLQWREEEEAIEKHGALARVTLRERERNPSADSSNISKDITKAKRERDEKNREGKTVARASPAPNNPFALAPARRFVDGKLQD